jgi:heme-degrading monooxygenase HmoA
MEEQYASGNWMVTPGREEDFKARWIEFLEWTRECADGLAAARLIQDAEAPRHFISFASWESGQALQSWRSLPGFASRLTACRELCDDFRGSNYTLAAEIRGTALTSG